MTLSFALDRIEMWLLARLQPYARNAKAHSADQVAKIAASMAEFGWTVPCFVAEDGELIAGHGRVLAATQVGLTEAPVIVLGHRRSPDQVKRKGWAEQGVLAVAVDDQRLTWPERELVRQLGEKLYGKRPAGQKCAMADWTRTMVEDRIETAADVFRALPGVRPQGYSNAWPEYFHSFGDKVTQRPETRLPRPGPRAITEAEAALLWLHWLEPEGASLVWLRANRTAWKPICWEFGISRATANRRWEYGLSVISWRLNGKRVPAKRSMDHVIQRAR